MPKNILLICDEENTAQELGRTLTLAGLSSYSVADGLSGVEQAKQFVPKVIVIGLVFSPDGGLAILERLRLLPETKSVPVVMLTAIDTEEYLAKAAKLGVQAQVAKPYDPKLIVEEVKNILKKTKGPQKKILVVDDDVMLVKMLDTRLTASGYEVVPVTDSAQAIHKVHIENPDLIVTDIMMPDVDGWQITRELKGSPEYKNIPIILLSSLIGKEGKGEKNEVGDYFMSKPVMMDKLLGKIKELLQK